MPVREALLPVFENHCSGCVYLLPESPLKPHILIDVEPTLPSVFGSDSEFLLYFLPVICYK